MHALCVIKSFPVINRYKVMVHGTIFVVVDDLKHWGRDKVAAILEENFQMIFLEWK